MDASALDRVLDCHNAYGAQIAFPATETLDAAREELAALRARVEAADALIDRLMENAMSWADCAIGLAETGGEKDALSRCLTRERVDFEKARRALRGET